MTLSEIAEVKSGYTFRSKVDVLPVHRKGSKKSKACFTIQMRDIDENGQLKPELLVPVDLDPDDLRKPMTIESGDIIFKSRGASLTVTMFDAESVRNEIRLDEWNIDANASVTFLLASPLHRIRVRDDGVLSKYLYRYMKSPLFQEVLSNISQGATMPMVKVSSLKNIVVRVPDLDTQKAVIELSELAEKEQALIHDYADKRKKFLEGVICDCIQSSEGSKQ